MELLCAPCLSTDVDTPAVTQVEGTLLCREHGASFAGTGRVRALAARADRQQQGQE